MNIKRFGQVNEIKQSDYDEKFNMPTEEEGEEMIIAIEEKYRTGDIVLVNGEHIAKITRIHKQNLHMTPHNHPGYNLWLCIKIYNPTLEIINDMVLATTCKKFKE